jgi:hypothetical protein
MVKLACILFLFLMTSSCNFFIGKDEKLSLVRRPVNTNSLRIDGFYYEGDIAPDETTTVYYFYQDGTVYSPGSYRGEKFEEWITKESTSSDLIAQSKKFKTSWGVFQIDNEKIVFEKWEPSSGPLFEVYRQSGTILNDSTFIIEKVVNGDDPLRNFIKEIYHFKKFKHKPDSTNDFVY